MGPETLTVVQSNALLDVFLKHTRTNRQLHKNIRNYLMALLMLDAGLRVSEVVGLTIFDLCLGVEARHSLLICENIAKKKSARVIPLSARIQAAITVAAKRLWAYYDLQITAYAFTSTELTKALTTRQVERIIGRAAQLAFGRWIHPHVLRHTFASRLMRTCNARIVQELLGHKHLASTQIYTHPNQDDLRKAIDDVEQNSQKT